MRYKIIPPGVLHDDQVPHLRKRTLRVYVYMFMVNLMKIVKVHAKKERENEQKNIQFCPIRTELIFSLLNVQWKALLAIDELAVITQIFFCQNTHSRCNLSKFPSTLHQNILYLNGYHFLLFYPRFFTPIFCVSSDPKKK